MDKNKVLGIAAPLISVAAIFGIWAAAAAATDNQYILPTIGQTFGEFFGLFGHAEFYGAVLNTLLRSLIAFVISFLLAFIFALAAEKSDFAAKLIAPVIAIIRALPTVAVVLLLLVWTNSRVAPVLVTMLVVLPTIFTNIKNALGAIDGDLVEMCRVYAVPKREVFFKVKVPAVLPQLLRSAGSGLSLNVKLMVAAEVLAQTGRSLGYLLNTSKVYLETATMIALVLVSVALGLIAEGVFGLLARSAEKRR